MGRFNLGRWRCLLRRGAGYLRGLRTTVRYYIQQPQTIEANSFAIHNISDIIRETRPDYRFVSPLHE